MDKNTENYICEECSIKFHNNHQKVYFNCMFYINKFNDNLEQKIKDKYIVLIFNECLKIHYFLNESYDNFLIQESFYDTKNNNQNYNLDDVSELHTESELHEDYSDVPPYKSYNNICSKCCNNFLKKKDEKIIKYNFLFDISINVTNLFRLLLHNKIYKDVIVFLKKNETYTNFVIDLIDDIEKLKIQSHLWMGKNWYYKKFFGIPYIIKRIGIPDHIYNMREKMYLNDYISGHPKASDGWFQESLNNLSQLGVF